MNHKEFLSIEGLRGILALSVCLGHYGLAAFLNSNGVHFNFHLAVDLFFVISGLVLAKSSYFCKQSLTVYKFIMKRTARLYPLHLLTLFIMVILYFFKSEPNQTVSVIKNMLLIQGLGFSPVDNLYNFPSWSISVELWSALGLFFIARYIKSTVLIMVFITAIFLQTLYWPTLLALGSYQANIIGFITTGLLRGLAGMGLGVIIFLMLNHRLGKRLFSSHVIGYAAALFLVSCFFIHPQWISSLGFYLGAFLFIGTAAQNRSFFRLLTNKWLVWLGTISYSIYLLHIPLYNMLQLMVGDSAVKGVQGKLILLPTLILLSIVSYLFFESPLQKKIKMGLATGHLYKV